MSEYRELVELGYQLQEVAQKRADAQSQVRKWASMAAEARTPEDRKRCNLNADRHAEKARALGKQESELSRQWDALNDRLKREWRRSKRAAH